MTEQFADRAQRYRLDSRIATGGMGVVWRATDIRLDREVAVKVLKDEYADDPTFRRRFDHEARNAASLHHPNIAGIFDYDADPTDGRAPFLVMELVDGKPLSTLLADAEADGRQLDQDVVRDLLAQAADGLAVAHRAGIVHRDVKPANLVVTADRRMKITDFGIARAADASTLTRTGAVMGTPQYLSPEQARGEAAVPASDVYSLGVVLFEALSGTRPFEGDSPVTTVLAHVRDPIPDLPDDVPAPLAAVVRRALAKKPEDRYVDAAAFATALRDPDGASAAFPPPPPATPSDSTAVLPATPATPVERLTPAAAYAGDEPPPSKRRRGAAWLVVVLVLLLVAAIVAIFWLLMDQSDDDPSPTTPTTSAATTEETTSETPTEPTDTGPETINLDQADYVGRNVSDVESELRQMGFDVQVEVVENDGSQEPDTVERIDPAGDVVEGSLITVHYYGDAPAESESPTEEETSETPTEEETSTVPDVTLGEGESG